MPCSEWAPIMAKICTSNLIYALIGRGHDDFGQAWREVDRKILSHFSADSTLESGLELLCSSEMSVHAVGRAMHHASKTVLFSQLNLLSYASYVIINFAQMLLILKGLGVFFICGYVAICMNPHQVVKYLLI